ncbi:hypothetical protein SAMN05660330_02470 [Desulforhopalus singaporensis]|uniref:Uncharacterized protein n=1 Tax=Desulforhopalus singaporensis TaxID=91360 RepID=A0A1H0RY13_9BACT|nr:hypothetical protein SAMN05660330_02470 [Desulforhopalus singaporensis]
MAFAIICIAAACIRERALPLSDAGGSNVCSCLRYELLTHEEMARVRLIPSFFILLLRVLGLILSSLAAPRLP